MKIKLKNEDAFNELLIRSGLSKRMFAKMVGIGEATAIQICNGARNPSPRIAKLIVECFKVPFDDIFVIEKCSRKRVI